MSNPHQQFHNALTVLETVFAPVSEQPFPVSGCLHCYREADIEALSGPISKVHEDLLCSAAGKSAEHWDDFSEFYQRLTPRTIRLLVAGRLHLGHDLIASRLREARWCEWPQDRREALENVWHAWWRSVLHEQTEDQRVTDVLELLSVSTGSLTPWLEIWSRTRTPAADQRLNEALAHWLSEWGLADLHLGFYGELHATPELLAWLLSLEPGRLSAARRAEIEDVARYADTLDTD
ncbi:hypothetical protein ACQEU3_42210 [Spirillospora sp. CA-253888]